LEDDLYADLAGECRTILEGAGELASKIQDETILSTALELHDQAEMILNAYQKLRRGEPAPEIHAANSGETKGQENKDADATKTAQVTQEVDLLNINEGNEQAQQKMESSRVPSEPLRRNGGNASRNVDPLDDLLGKEDDEEPGPRSYKGKAAVPSTDPPSVSSEASQGTFSCSVIDPK